MICFYSLAVGILKIITFGLLLSEKGALSAIPIEGNCTKRPKAALSPFPTKRKCAECPEGLLSESCRL